MGTVKSKFDDFKESMTDLMKQVASQDDAIKSIFNMNKDEMAMMANFIKVYKESIDLTAAMCEALDEIKSDTTLIKWRLDSNSEQLGNIEKALIKETEKEEQ